MPRVFPRFFGILASSILATGIATTAAMGQEAINYWTNSNGGNWNRAKNWSQGFVPGAQDAAYLILGSEYSIASEFTLVDELYVEDGNVELRTIDAGNFEVRSLLRIGHEPPRDARLALRGPGSSFAGSVAIGSVFNEEAEPGGELTLGPTRRLDVSSLVGFRHAVLRFELGANSGNLWSGAQLTVFGSASFSGPVIIEPRNGAFPPPGTEIQLLEGNFVDLPPLYLVKPPPGLELDLTYRFGDAASLSAKVVEAETVTRIDLQQEIDAEDAPADLLVGDLDGDGDRDLVILRESGKNLVLVRLTNGDFEPFSEFVSAPGTIEGSMGDYDGDGKLDIAVISSDSVTGDLLQVFRNPDGNADMEPGPFTDVGFLPISLSNLRITDGFADSTGLAVTGSDDGRGRTKGYRSSDTDLTKTGEVEVGDDPGPSDPVDDETKKDEGSDGDAVAVASDSGTALVGRPVLRILRSAPGSNGDLEIERTVPLSGRAIDFVSGDIDNDGQVETLVLTADDRLEILDFSLSTTFRNSIPIPPGAVALTLGDLGADGNRELVIAYRYTAALGALQVYRVLPQATPDSPFGNRLLIERRRSILLDQLGPSNAVLVPGIDGRVILGGGGQGGAGLVEARRLDEVPIDPCEGFDLNGDGRVDSADLGVLLEQWGRCRGDCTADFDGDGVVGPIDLGLLASGWGPC